MRSLFTVTAAALLASSAQPSDGPAPDLPRYAVVHGWPILPEGRILGQATGVDVDAEGRVHVFHRAGREWLEEPPAEPIAHDTIAVFEGAGGRLLRSWGAGLFLMPHGLTVDQRGNVWVTDVLLQQVFKFSPEGELLMTLGEARVAGNDQHHFNYPTDVAVLPDGSFYVSDGYANTRVVKFGRDGRFEFQWGEPGTRPGQFDLPHAIDVDVGGRVYVADRSNARVQVFDGRGRFISQWRSDALGRPYSLAVSGERAFVVDGGDQPESGPDRSGAAEVALDGTILSRFGRFGNQDGQFRLAHDVAVGPDGAVYVVDAWGQRVQKFVRRR